MGRLEGGRGSRAPPPPPPFSRRTTELSPHLPPRSYLLSERLEQAKVRDTEEQRTRLSVKHGSDVVWWTNHKSLDCFLNSLTNLTRKKELNKKERTETSHLLKLSRTFPDSKFSRAAILMFSPRIFTSFILLKVRPISLLDPHLDHVTSLNKHRTGRPIKRNKQEYKAQLTC